MATPADTEARALAAIDADGLVACLRELIAIRSLGGEEDAAQAFVADRIAREGLRVDRWRFPIDPLRAHPHFSMEVERTAGEGVVGTLPGKGGGRSLILNGHVDVVPVGDEGNWTVLPWQGTVRDGRVYGRGAVDMKGGLVCALFAAKALVESGVTLRGDLLIESVIGEEDGGVGTLATSLRGYRADGAIVLEPTELVVAPAQAGALCFRITVDGRSAHACVREEGVSALEKFLPVQRALADLEARRNQAVRDPMFSRYRLPFALNLGRVQAGEWPSSVPERLAVEGRYGIAVGEPVAAARAAFEDAIRSAAASEPWLRDHPPRVEWWGGQFDSASTPVDHPVVTSLVSAVETVLGAPARLEGMTYGSDMRLLVHVARTPTVLFGPGDVRRSHRPDESVAIDDLVAATRAIVVAAIRFCGEA